MLQNIRSVLIGLTKESGPDETSSALAYGLSLAQQAGAHVTVQAASVKLVLNSAWVSDVAAGLVQAENRRLQTLAEAAAASAGADAAATGVSCVTHSPHLAYPDLLVSFRAQARVHDFAILDAEAEVLNLDRGLFETLLLDSGRPVIVVPPGQDAFAARRVIVAWDGSARVARAANDALPILRAAETAEVVAVSGEKDVPDVIDGAELATHLARHGVKVEVNRVRARDGDVAQTLRDRAASYGADMIVMGGYVHSRLREMVFGGVTQSLLKSSPVPLFMSY
jgi:nucleotide-binding universal stress UspA family protein